ncbi:hypothetical protein HanIR_Chr15g0750121 [Helianthus annuus]|nr:hypothetical protein HanIR_Chr15g0750121 [Helianthus annuus]
MQQTRRTGMQIPATPLHIIPTEPMLVPPVINRFNITTKHQQKRWQRTQLIDPFLLLDLHPVLDPFPVVSGSPFLHIHHHHPRVEVTRFFRSRPEYPGHNRVGPETVGEVVGEISVTVFRSSDNPVVF